jgi:predicted regulator of Ras-like GTPase activity (Roadblock/LC7/MglB family)
MKKIDPKIRRKEMGGSLVLSAELIDGVDSVLAMLQRKTQANCILLADISGQLISQMGTLDHLEAAHFSALAASNMAATTAMAKMIGEKKHFKLLFHEGERKNVYLSNVGDSFLLVVIFSPSVQIGLVLLFAKQAAQKLIPLSEACERLQLQLDKVIGADFVDALAQGMNKAFDGPNYED